MRIMYIVVMILVLSSFAFAGPPDGLPSSYVVTVTGPTGFTFQDETITWSDPESAWVGPFDDIWLTAAAGGTPAQFGAAGPADPEDPIYGFYWDGTLTYGGFVSSAGPFDCLTNDSVSDASFFFTGARGGLVSWPAGLDVVGSVGSAFLPYLLPGFAVLATLAGVFFIFRWVVRIRRRVDSNLGMELVFRSGNDSNRIAVTALKTGKAFK